MNLQSIREIAGDYSLFSGITQRYLDLVNEEDLDWAPKPDMFTLRKLIVHIYSGIGPLCRAMETCTITKEDDFAEEAEALKLSIADLRAYCWSRRNLYLETVAKLTDEQVAQTIHIYYGDFPAGLAMSFVPTEHLHHRGQLSVYLRLLGKALPFAYDYENNPK